MRSWSSVHLTCGMAAQNSFNNFTLLCRAALPRFTHDDASITLAALRAVLLSKPSVSCLHKHWTTTTFQYRLGYVFWKKYFQNIAITDPGSVPSIHTYRSILPILVSAATLAKRNAFVTTENQATLTDTSLHTRLVTGAAGACGVLTAGLGAGIGTVVVVTAWWTF